MNKRLRDQLIAITRKYSAANDPSHDINHLIRILHLAERIAGKEKADMDVIVPAALFHDVVVYPKNSSKSKHSAEESAVIAKKVLKGIRSYPKGKITAVATCILECSFSKGVHPSSLESKILQDADRLEATGAISIMRTFSSGGEMRRPFYPPEDPLCEKKVEGKTTFRSDMDLFYNRLLRVGKLMHTKEAKRLAKGRTLFLKSFLRQLRIELKESGVL